MNKICGFVIVDQSSYKELCSHNATDEMKRSLYVVLASDKWNAIRTTSTFIGSSLTLESENILFHIHVTSMYIYSIMTSLNYNSNTIYDKFLPEIITYLNKTNKANINSAENKKWFSDLIVKYSDHKIDDIKFKIGEIKKTMIENINHAIIRGEKVEELEHKTNELKNSAQHFEIKSKSLKNKIKCKNFKLTAIISSIVIVVLILVIVAIVV